MEYFVFRPDVLDSEEGWNIYKSFPLKRVSIHDDLQGPQIILFLQDKGYIDPRIPAPYLRINGSRSHFFVEDIDTEFPLLEFHT